MAEHPSNNPLKNSGKAATPLLLPPPQINSPSVDTSNNSTDTNDTSPTNEKLNPLYTQSSLQPHMGPIEKTPLLNPMALSINSLSESDSRSQLQSMHFKTLFNKQTKYTRVNTNRNTINNNNNNIDDEIDTNNESKSSVTLDRSRLIDEDQKIIETIHINRDDSIEEDIISNVNINNINNINDIKYNTIIAGGIPTTPSYPTPPIHPITNIYTTLTEKEQNSSLFMDQQQHRKRTNKLKFSRNKWCEHGKRVLLNTTVRVDRVCHTLVQTRQRFGICPVEMRELSLIVAVIERAMYSYGTQVQKNKEKLKLTRNTNNNLLLSNTMESSISAPINYNPQMREEIMDVNSEDSVETIGKCTNTSINNITPRIKYNITPIKYKWRHPGGVVSLLEILGRVLKSTEEELISIGKIASITDFVSNNKLMWIISILFGTYIFTVPFSKQIRFIKIYKLLIRVSPLNIFKSININIWMNRFRFIILPTLIYILHKIILRIYLNKLWKLKNQLNSIILHWQLCMTAINPKNRLDQSLSHRIPIIINKNNNNNNNNNKIDIYQWILRLVPPSAHIDACFWYSANFRLKLLRKLMDVNYAVTCYYYRIFGSSTLFWPMAFPILFYYILSPHRAACRANEFLANPDIRIIRVFYSILDSKLARWITLKVFPKLRLMPQLKTAITFEIRVDDINSWNYYDIGKFKNIDTVRIKIFATKKLNIKPDYINSGNGNSFNDTQFLNEPIATNLININNNNYPAHQLSVNDASNDEMNDIINIKSPINPTLICSNNISKNQIQKQQENGVIFYIHGGGFLGNFCASDLRILSQWSELVNAPIVEVDYSLIPSKWPQQLQECILAYKCLCYGRLGFNARRIAVIGDSNGGGLAVSMILNIIQCGLRVPDVLILTSPILSLRQTQLTTSKLLFNMDPLVPMNLIVQLTKYYLIPTICDDENDPLISPLIAAPDYLLSSFPPTTIVVGGLDPFLDDSVDFAHRLSNNDVNVDVKLKIYKFSPHAFLNFNYILPDVNHAIHLIAECIDQAFLS